MGSGYNGKYIFVIILWKRRIFPDRAGKMSDSEEKLKKYEKTEKSSEIF